MHSLVPLRVMRAGDIPAGLRLCRASGWNQLAPDWERFLAFSPDGCRVALGHSGEVIGSIATLRFGDRFAWIAMVLVDPAHRRAGIGTRLLQEALLLLEDMPAVRLDATPAGFHVYEPAGFREEYPLQRMRRRLFPARLIRRSKARDDTPSMSMRLMSDGDLDEVFAWDEAGVRRRPARTARIISSSGSLVRMDRRRAQLELRPSDKCGRSAADRRLRIWPAGVSLRASWSCGRAKRGHRASSCHGLPDRSSRSSVHGRRPCATIVGGLARVATICSRAAIHPYVPWRSSVSRPAG